MHDTVTLGIESEVMCIDVTGNQMGVDASPHNAVSGFVASRILAILIGYGLLYWHLYMEPY